jgi:hypothetical protein
MATSANTAPAAAPSAAAMARKAIVPARPEAAVPGANERLPAVGDLQRAVLRPDRKT